MMTTLLIDFLVLVVAIAGYRWFFYAKAVTKQTTVDAVTALGYHVKYPRRYS